MAAGYCSNCGHAVSPGERYCSSCGAALGVAEPQPPHAPAPPPPPPSSGYGQPAWGEASFEPVYDATPGVVMGILGFFCGLGPFLHIPALVMGMRGRAAPANRNAPASFWLGVIGLVWDGLFAILFLLVLFSGGSEDAAGAAIEFAGARSG